MNNESLTKYIAHFVDELAANDVTNIVISPGSRSTPLAVLMADHSEITIHVLIDERSAGFYALGLAKASRKPVGLVCTSGTAAANYYPAIIEAHYSRVPLLVLTADRPHELRDVGAPQAIDQNKLYGEYVKWFADLALPEHSSSMLRYIRTVTARAIGTTLAKPAGPVHLNFPLREPLLPDLNYLKWDDLRERSKFVQLPQSISVINEEETKRYADFLSSKQKGLIVCGELHEEKFSEWIIALSEKLQFPILADPLSNLRSGSHTKKTIIDQYDSLLKDEEIKQHLKPEVVIRFGSMPVSKPLFQLLRDHPEVYQMVVDGHGGWRDPTMAGSEMIECDETRFCKSLVHILPEKKESNWLEQWVNINHVFRNHLNDQSPDNEPIFEGSIYQDLKDLLPEKCQLFIGNSMPIRDMDTFFQNTNKQINIFANRGANGIDGVVSAALGVSAASSFPSYLVIGDLSFYHDLNGLLASKMLKIPLTILLINNDGGGIFSFLPQSKEEKHFEALFGTPSGLDFQKAIEMYGGAFCRVKTRSDLRAALQSNQQKGLQVIEIITNRQTRVKTHRELLERVSQEIKREFLT
ncbi:2-succinyl-5-enolpyruvyl-6-hydroxy-3-cyclohexene-1-carboxylic-acid synthase [Metabacillus arenae]|uniref:2-succinyl-5-enolpyruvyl-6-hydroxy-3-cyclohexene-1-carboxylate synthase n=1 Tax=Metabacillus arenae TaxID=2771434 RepID=A0A926RWT6_9BACI|nr:2-succinyl-5-enolpyruvyl-6-hydroxy-3-cyclohexene-1-carboxylic-acid synthase [Metabacillus arenae]MBD1380266.1 2-succinyl-5-enolpyruvyl-6-hydroxy-3-cyclohexene-1-carboxylic-acid synthase [Metabacillus arenae]